jgi:hypothetical protein
MKENEFIISLKDGISSNVMRKLNMDIWINREDVCIGCHNDNCEGCEYVKYFKE